ncbi:MAG: sugar ABC transporter permease [Anaerolineaceae bacterium]|nr:sugar ABC transporter permease [Anaerolineaceae bacterium]MDE0329796.1 sugar ABC transporter permease [Anaerolineaceae bacterium]MDE0609825.1 sugar ABC transporter permease [Anaerolineaceae bacterium]
MHPDARVSRIERFRLRAGLGRWNPGQQSEAWIFLIPGLAGFVIFVLVPIVMSMGVSLTRWDLLGPPEFVGIANYVELLTRDRIFSRVLGNTLYYTVVIVPLQLGLGLTLATALNQQIRAMSLYRLIYFMPVVTNIVAAALVFQWLLNRDFGIISSIIWDIAERYGVPVQPPDWINNPVWSKPAVVLLTIWKNVGFTMVIYLAGLQGVPEALYDAARVDGANGWQRFRYVTIPMVSPTTFFLLVIQMIGAFQLFAEPFVLFGGEPPQSTLSIVYYIWQNAFEFFRMGKATAIAWLLFAIIFVVTFIQLRLQRRWVHYEV